MIRLVALDIAGTTVQEHSAVYAALREAVTAAGATPSAQDIQDWMGAGKREAITALLQGGSGAGAVAEPGAHPGAELVDEVFADFRARLAAAYRATPAAAVPRGRGRPGPAACRRHPRGPDHRVRSRGDRRSAEDPGVGGR